MIIIEAVREGYSPDQCGNTMTVAELIEELEQYEGDEKIYFSHDNGYTYGALKSYRISYEEPEDEEDEDEEE